MKAGIYLGKKNVVVEDREMPVVGANDVLIKNIFSSVCGTDAAVWQFGPETGHRIAVGREFGHETISRVVAVGENVTDIRPGERVYPYPRFVKKDHSRAGTIGGFSEYILVENARKNYNLYEIDPRIPDKLACLIEPFTVGCRAARRGMIPDGMSNGKKIYKSGENSVVFGAGTIGIAAAIAQKHFGAAKVMLCDLSDLRLGLAKELGFEVCNTGREDFSERAKEYFGSASSLSGEAPDIDCFIDAAGAESILDDFLRLGKFDSRFVSVAVNKKPRTIDLLHMTYAQQSIIGSGGYMPEDVADVQEIMTCGRWAIEKIITHEFALEELPTALETASDAKRSGNVVIRMGAGRD